MEQIKDYLRQLSKFENPGYINSTNMLIYLASPYTSKLEDPLAKLTEQEARFVEACRIASSLMKQGYHIYSPIAHCHPIAVRFGLPTDWEYWKTHAEVMITHSDQLWIATMPGHEESTGVQGELLIARNLNKIVHYIDPKDV